MAETAFQKQYRQETIAAFEVQQSLMRRGVTTETVIKGNTAEFLVAGSGGATATTRGTNGLIPARGDDNQQYTATLVEWHDLVRKTRFNIFASQGDQRALMQRTTMAVLNRKCDDDIITEMSTATVNTGTAATASLALCLRAKTILGNSDVTWDGNIWCAITPGFEAYLMLLAEFSSADYVDHKPYPEADPAWSDEPQQFFKWIGVNWFVHPNLPGAGGASEVCFMWHKNSFGHAFDSDTMDTAVGYNDEQDYSYARCTGFMGSQILQNSGIVKINHDSSAWAAA